MGDHGPAFGDQQARDHGVIATITGDCQQVTGGVVALEDGRLYGMRPKECTELKVRYLGTYQEAGNGLMRNGLMALP